jgi:hypothetical protein
MAVDELAKPPGVWCEHCVRSKGCAIYRSRPAGCREFYCEWMLSDKLGPEWKPDRAKFALMVTVTGHLAVCIDPGLPSAWRRSPYYPALARWARELADDPTSPWPAVDVWIGRRCILVLPDGEKDLGIVAADEAVRIDRTTTDTGAVYAAEKFTVSPTTPHSADAQSNRAAPSAPFGRWLRKFGVGRNR